MTNLQTCLIYHCAAPATVNGSILLHLQENTMVTVACASLFTLRNYINSVDSKKLRRAEQSTDLSKFIKIKRNITAPYRATLLQCYSFSSCGATLQSSPLIRGWEDRNNKNKSFDFTAFYSKFSEIYPELKKPSHQFLE